MEGERLVKHTKGEEGSTRRLSPPSPVFTRPLIGRTKGKGWLSHRLCKQLVHGKAWRVVIAARSRAQKCEVDQPAMAFCWRAVGYLVCKYEITTEVAVSLSDS